MKKILMVTNHSYMLWQFRRELIRTLLKDYEVAVSTPFAGHERDFAEMGCQMIQTDIDRRGINPVTDLKLIKAYNKILKENTWDMVITYSIKPNIYGNSLPHEVDTLLCACTGFGYCFSEKRSGTDGYYVISVGTEKSKDSIF